MSALAADLVATTFPVVTADPYPWPWNGDLRPDNTALIVIDMQTDFCGPGGYVDRMGYDLVAHPRADRADRTRAGCMRERGLHVFHTREGHRPDLADLPANKRWRSRQIGAGHRRSGPVRPGPGARRAGLGDHPRAGAAAPASR